MDFDPTEDAKMASVEDAADSPDDDAPPVDTNFTPRERRTAEAFIILQRRLARLNYKYVRDWLREQRKD